MLFVEAVKCLVYSIIVKRIQVKLGGRLSLGLTPLDALDDRLVTIGTYSRNNNSAMTARDSQKYHDRTYLRSFSNDPSYPLEELVITRELMIETQID
jgi:hypothetical protein